MTISTAIKLVDVELTSPLNVLEDLHDYREVRCLIRFHGVPLAWRQFPVVVGKCDLRREIARNIDKLVYPLSCELLRQGLVRGDSLKDMKFAPYLQNKSVADSSCSLSMTVAVCTRNRTAGLASCVDSLIKLAYPDLDILVVDNAPVDDRAKRLINNSYPTIRYFREPKPGLNWARNRALAEAKGNVIAYTDDDVVVDSGWAAAIAAAFASNPNVEAVTGLVVPQELETPAQRLFEEYGGFDRGFKRRWIRAMPGIRDKQAPWGTGQFGTGANMAFRTESLRRVGGFDPALDVGTVTNGGGDLEILFRVLRHGGTLVYEPRAIVRHRHRRSYEELKSQITNNGIGLMSYFRRACIAYPSERSRFIRLALWWLRNWHLKRLLRSFVNPYAFPRELLNAEIIGFFKGIPRYKRARKRAIQLGGEDKVARKPVKNATRNTKHRNLRNSSMAIARIDLNEQIPEMIDSAGFRRCRLFVFAGEHYLGRTDIKNQGRTVAKSEVIDQIVSHFGLRLLDPTKRVSKDSLWAHASQAIEQLVDMKIGRPSLLTTGPADQVSVSVVIATLDRPELLRRCLQSLDRQETSREVEIVVVDNRPQSGLTAPVVAEFPEARYLTQEIRGLSYARNTGVVAANGDILITIDDDVVVPDDWLEKLIRPFATADVAAVTGNILPFRLDSEAAVLFERYGGLGRGEDALVANRKWMSSFRRHAVPTWRLGATANAAFRADIFATAGIGLFDEALGAGSPTGCSEDTLLFYKILAAGWSIAYQPDAWLWHEHRNSMPALRTQLYNYSKGHVAYHLLVYAQHRDLRSLRRVLLTLPLWRLRQIYAYVRRRIRGGEPDFPLSLILLELLGNLVGPWSLARSLLRVRKHGRIQPPVTKSVKHTIASANPDVP